VGFKLYANLFYGIDLGLGLADINEYDDLERIVADENGLDADKDWKKIREITETLPVDIACHGDGGEALALLVRGVKVIEAYDNKSTKISKDDLEVDETLVGSFREWCVKHGIENPAPSWLLVGTNN
jgi:hypothetical protein